jgi:hypothetical protein
MSPLSRDQLETMEHRATELKAEMQAIHSSDPNLEIEENQARLSSLTDEMLRMRETLRAERLRWRPRRPHDFHPDSAE